MLTFSPLAWLKLQMFLHAGDTEVGGFALSRAGDLLYVEDFITVKQVTTCVTVEFDDTAVADYFDQCVDQKLTPARFARIWCHTHPGDSPDPSGVDEDTFGRVFGSCDWSIMFILSSTGRTYARLNFAAGPGGSVLLPVAVDWASWPEVVVEQQDQLPLLMDEWMDEYGRNIHSRINVTEYTSSVTRTELGNEDWFERVAELEPVGMEAIQDGHHDLCGWTESEMREMAEMTGVWQ